MAGRKALLADLLKAEFVFVLHPRAPLAEYQSSGTKKRDVPGSKFAAGSLPGGGGWGANHCLSASAPTFDMGAIILTYLTTPGPRGGCRDACGTICSCVRRAYFLSSELNHGFLHYPQPSAIENRL